MIYVIEDDEIMAECIAAPCRKSGQEVRIFHDAVAAVNALNDNLPSLIFLDILLTGPDGFTFLNEIVSYEDTAKIPVVVVSSLNFENQDLSHYGIKRILKKDTMTPNDIKNCLKEFVL